MWGIRLVVSSDEALLRRMSASYKDCGEAPVSERLVPSKNEIVKNAEVKEKALEQKRPGGKGEVELGVRAGDEDVDEGERDGAGDAHKRPLANLWFFEGAVSRAQIRCRPLFLDDLLLMCDKSSDAPDGRKIKW